MSIVEVAEELQAYLNTHEVNRRTRDAVDESLQMLKQELSEEQRQREVKRLGDIISFLLEKEEENDGKLAMDLHAKRQFSDELERKLKECLDRCNSMVEVKGMEQIPLIQGFEDDFRTRMNVELNGKQMEVREKWSRLVLDGYKSLSERVRSVVKEFTASVMEEMDFFMDKVRKRFAETQVADCKTSYQEINQTVMSNYDVMQKELLVEAENYEYPIEKFENFNKKNGVKLEKATRKEQRFSFFLKIIPLIIYMIKHVCDNYLFPKETWVDKLMNLLMVWLEDAMQKGSDAFLKVLEVALQFVQEGGEVAALTAEFLTLFLFVGWLYYIYIKIVNKIRQKRFYRKQQAILQPATAQFLKELNIKDEIKNAFKEMETKVAERYIQKHRVLFEKLVEPVGQEPERNTLQKIQYDYLESIGNGGVS